MPAREKFRRISEEGSPEDILALFLKEKAHRQVIAGIMGDLYEDESITKEEYHKLMTFISDLSLDEFFAVMGCFGACFLSDYQESMEDIPVISFTIDLGGLNDRPGNARTND